jgi:hypothetical protein
MQSPTWRGWLATLLNTEQQSRKTKQKTDEYEGSHLMPPNALLVEGLLHPSISFINSARALEKEKV